MEVQTLPLQMLITEQIPIRMLLFPKKTNFRPFAIRLRPTFSKDYFSRWKEISTNSCLLFSKKDGFYMSIFIWHKEMIPHMVRLYNMIDAFGPCMHQQNFYINHLKYKCTNICTMMLFSPKIISDHVF